MSLDRGRHLWNCHHQRGNRRSHHQKFPCVPWFLFTCFRFVHFGFVFWGWEHLTWDLPSWQIFKGRYFIEISLVLQDECVLDIFCPPHPLSLTILHCPRPVFAQFTSQERTNGLKGIEKNREIMFRDMWEVHEIQIPVSIKFYQNTAVPDCLFKVCDCLCNILRVKSLLWWLYGSGSLKVTGWLFTENICCPLLHAVHTEVIM